MISWPGRYGRSGMGGLGGLAARGRPSTVDRAKILTATLTPAPNRLGITHWSSWLLAAYPRTDQSSMLRTWRHHRVQPWRAHTFKFSTDPEWGRQGHRVVGLYTAPPQNAIVLCVDEKAQNEAVDRTQMMLPMQPRTVQPRLHPPRHP